MHFKLEGSFVVILFSVCSEYLQYLQQVLLCAASPFCSSFAVLRQPEGTDMQPSCVSKVNSVILWLAWEKLRTGDKSCKYDVLQEHSILTFLVAARFKSDASGGGK